MLYPTLETSPRRDSDEVFEVPELKQSNLERNCGQIFVKGPALTKDFLVKMNSDIVPKKTYLFGRALNTKRILFISGLFLLFFLSLLGVVVMWGTEFFDNTVLSSLTISNTSDHYKMWSKPSPKLLVNVYIFNYTNVEEFEDRMEKKLRVQEVGPYVYQESVERVNVVFNDDDTVSYQEKRIYKFLPHLSKGKQSDRIVVPNIPLWAGAAKTKYRNYFERLGFSALLKALEEKPFLNLAADNFITGYSNDFYDMSRSVSKLNSDFLPEKVGILTGKSGVQPNVYTVNTGKNDISRIGIIEKINGKKAFNYWSTEECNSIQGTDGTMFPPKLVQQRQPLSYVFPQVCRSFPFVFDKEVTILDGKVPAHRYVIPEDIYDSAEEVPEHQCYCDMNSGICPPQGVFNITPCNTGAPLFISHPHFHRAAKSLFTGISGLNSVKKDVTTYMDLHPIMGFIMSGRTTIQMNVQVQKSSTIYQLDAYDDGLMLPFAWVEGTLAESTLPQDFLDIIYDATYTLKGVKLAFRWGCLLTMLITAICINLAFKNKWQKLYRSWSSRSQTRQVNETLEEI